MSAKRLNVMLYSASSGEQLILPVNPERIEIKYEKDVETFDILGFGKIHIAGYLNPVKIRLAHFLPEDDSPFAEGANIMYTAKKSGFAQYEYSIFAAVNILKNWAGERRKIRLVIDDEINSEFMVFSFSQTLRENVLSKPYILELIEYKNPAIKRKGAFGLIGRTDNLSVPENFVMKTMDTIYSVSDKYKLDFKKVAKINNIKNVNANIAGRKISLVGAN